MNLEQAIHDRLVADQNLTALLPAEQFVTGRYSGGRLPYATIQRRKNRNLLRTNTGELDEAYVLVLIWHDVYDGGRAIADLVVAALEGYRLSLTDGQHIKSIHRSIDSAEQHDDGLWRFLVEFVVRTYLPHGT